MESHRTDILPCKKSQRRSKAMKTSKCYQKFCYIFVVPLESPSQHLLLSPRPWLPQRALFCQPGSPQRSPSLGAVHAMEVTSSLLANLSICCHSRGIGKALLRCHTACCYKFFAICCQCLYSYPLQKYQRLEIESNSFIICLKILLI